MDIHQKKEDAKKLFATLQNPSEREEEWRYTNISKIDLNPATNEKNKLKMAGDNSLLREIGKSALNAPEVKKYLYMQEKRDKIEIFNEAFWKNGFFALGQSGKVGSVKINVSGITRNLVVAQPGSTLNIVENASRGTKLNNSLTNIIVMEGATVNYFAFENFNSDVKNFSTRRAYLSRDAAINWSFCVLGCSLTRNVNETILNGEGSVSNTKCVFFSRENDHVDISVNAFHRTSNTTNNIEMKGALKDMSSSILRGTIRIDKTAPGTRSYMSMDALKLDEGTLANSIPSLFIENNDVKASHGATIGQIDEEQMFYLKSRGLDEKTAERTIVQGFFGHVIANIDSKNFRNRIKKSLEMF